MSAHEEMKTRTDALETAVYGLLHACDDYRQTAEGLLAAEQESASPRHQLVHRLEQLSARATRVIRILEDDVLTEMLPMMDRLFAVERAERGVDI